MKKLLALFLLGAAGSLPAADPVEFTVGSFTFDRPSGWQWIVPSSPMRKAQLAVPGPEGTEAAEVTFFHFGAGQGGSVKNNLDRWIGQFQGTQAETAETKVSGTMVHFVRATGTFASGMPGGPTTPRPGFALRGAILESPEGDVYVKMTGPEAVLTGAAAAFEKMVHTAAARTTAAPVPAP
jgi:hypothetical protein